MQDTADQACFLPDPVMKSRFTPSFIAMLRLRLAEPRRQQMRPVVEQEVMLSLKTTDVRFGLSYTDMHHIPYAEAPQIL